MARAEPARRRFFTVRDIEDVGIGGRLVIGPRDVVTDEGRGRALDRGVEIIVQGSQPAPSGAPTPSAGSSPAHVPASSRQGSPSSLQGSPSSLHAQGQARPQGGQADASRLRAAIITAVRAELGDHPGIEQAVDAVLAREAETR